MARSLALLALAGAATVAAQTTTVNVFLPMFDKQALDASVIAADADKTTLFINCPATADSSDCGVASGGQSVVYGPKTFSLNYSYDGGSDGSYVEDIDCKLEPSKDWLSCSVSVSQEYDGTTTASSTAVASTGYLELLIPVTITAGANKLKDDSEATATTLSTVAAPASTTGSADATATESGASKSGSSESTPAAESASTTPTAVSSGNAAGAQVTQNAVLVGAAALVGGAAMLL